MMCFCTQWGTYSCSASTRISQQVALPYTEPLVHFALVCGTRSGPALRCYSAGDVDKELMEAASRFLRTGGLYVDTAANVAYVSSLLKW